MFNNLLKSIVHNLGVIIVGFVFAFLCTRIDLFLNLTNFQSFLTISVGLLLLTIGFLIRLWATYYFYEHKMGVIKLSPQNTLLTTGPYRFSRNPLYLGGNVFIFFGAVIFLGSPTGIALTILQLPLTDWMVRREEKQLERTFGKEWTEYKKRVRRWL